MCQLQYEVRRSAEKYHAACVACDHSKQTLINIEHQSSSSMAGDSAAASFSAEKQEALNRATDEVLMCVCTAASLQRAWLIPVQYNYILLISCSWTIISVLRVASLVYKWPGQVSYELHVVVMRAALSSTELVTQNHVLIQM